MITLTSIEYELNELPDIVLSRLKWAVEEIDYNWLDYLNNWKTTPATHKNWIGKIDKKNLNFTLEIPGPLFKRKINVMVKGYIEQRASTTNVHIKLGLENLSFIWILMIYLLSALILSDAFINDKIDDYFSLGVFLIAYPVLGTILIKRRLKKAEKKLDFLFH